MWGRLVVDVTNFACAKNGKHPSQNNLGECLIDASSADLWVGIWYVLLVQLPSSLLAASISMPTLVIRIDRVWTFRWNKGEGDEEEEEASPSEADEKGRGGGGGTEGERTDEYGACGCFYWFFVCGRKGGVRRFEKNGRAQDTHSYQTELRQKKYKHIFFWQSPKRNPLFKGARLRLRCLTYQQQKLETWWRRISSWSH